MSLDAAVALRLGALELDVALTVPTGGALAVLGPNGAGKSTLLRILAGLRSADRALVALDGTTLDDTERGISVPAEARSIGYVFPDLRLFPHLTARDNVAFGLRTRGIGRTDAARRAAEWLERLDVARVADRRPGTLSGGEAQRVALARALAAEPALLLLDEPLSAVDVASRATTRSAMRTAVTAGPGDAPTRLIVTHDPVDAATLAECIVIVEDGRVVQSGSLAELAARPRSPYVADLVGVNLLRGTAEGGRIRLDGGGELAVVGRTSGPALAVVHPRAVALHRMAPAGSPRNAWAVRITAIEPLGDRVRVRVSGPPDLVAEITATALGELALEPGAPAWAVVKATEVRVLPD